MQAAVQKGLDTQAAGLTEGNAALAQLIAQLEQLGAGNAPARQQEWQQQQCEAPCVDLSKHPILHSSACVCAEGALGSMVANADRAARHAGRAMMGEL